MTRRWALYTCWVLTGCAGHAPEAAADPHPRSQPPTVVAAAADEPPALPPASDAGAEPALPPAAPAEPVTALSAGNGHTCALHQDGRVSCWGDNGVGQAGGAPTADHGSDPHWVALPQPAVQVAAGHFHTCVLDLTGEVWCFGSFLAGTQVSPGGVSGSTALEKGHDDLGVPTKVLAAPNESDRVRHIAVSLTTSRACAALQQRVVCWNTAAELGPASLTESMDLKDVEELAVGAARTCAIVSRSGKRRIECWEHGDKKPSAVTWPSAAAPVEISIGSLHTCARDARGGAHCWRIGVTGTHWWKKQPQRISGLGKGGARSISAGGDLACAAAGDGSVGCFLAEPEGLPDGVAANAWAAPRDKAQTIPGVEHAVLVTTGQGRNVYGNGYACALAASGEVTCWGDDDSGQLGDGKRATASGAVKALAPR